MHSELHIPAEKDILAAQLNLYAKKAGYKLAPMVEKLAAENNGDFTKYVNSSIRFKYFTSVDKVKHF